MRGLAHSLALPVAIAATLALAGCGDDEKDGAGAGKPRPVTEAATTVPRYEGDPKATKAPPKGEAALDDLPKAERAGADTPEPNIRGSAGLSLQQFLDTLGNDVATFWQEQFNASGYRFEPGRQAVVTAPVSTACEPPAVYRSDSGPAYCSGDETIFLPVDFFSEQARPIGDAAVALVVAHEYGHRVQHLLGLFQARAEGRVLGRDLELQADCFAGVWAASIYRRGLLEPGDIEEALTIEKAAGDAPGTPVNAPGAHGTGEERQAAFSKGYRGGDPGACKL